MSQTTVLPASDSADEHNPNFLLCLLGDDGPPPRVKPNEKEIRAVKREKDLRFDHD